MAAKKTSPLQSKLPSCLTRTEVKTRGYHRVKPGTTCIQRQRPRAWRFFYALGKDSHQRPPKRPCSSAMKAWTFAGTRLGEGKTA